MKMKQLGLLIVSGILLVGCSTQPQEIRVEPVIELQPNITIIMETPNEIESRTREVAISTIISKEVFERNDIQNYNSVKQNECVNKFKGNNINSKTIMGVSMKPTLSEGNTIICDSSITKYESGMIISFQKDDKDITHRIKAVYPNYVITQGDNNMRDDGRINLDQINCVVIGVCY